MKSVIIIPTYNERRNISVLIEEIFKFVSQEVRVLVVDDNSPDNTADIVREIMKNNSRVSLLLRSKKEGLGKAYLHAFSEVFKDKDIECIVMMDADFSHNPKYLSKMFEIASNYDVVVGSRYIKETGSGTEGWELWRRILSRWGNFYCRTISSMPIYDCTGGYNLIRIDLLKKLDFNKFDSSGYAFLVELKYSLFQKGGRFREIPIIFKNRKEGESKISNHIIREGIIAPWKLLFKK